MIKAIIFDAYGVLITDALVPMIEARRTTDPDGARQASDLLRATSRGLVVYGDFVEQMADIMGMNAGALQRIADSGEAKNAPLLGFILELRRQYKTAVLSNISMQGFWRRFSREELNTYFDVVVPSAEIGFIKPEPEAYTITAEKLGVAPDQCIMVDDRQACVDGARAVGMQAILYQSLQELAEELARFGAVPV